MSIEAQRVYLTDIIDQRKGDFAFPFSLPNQPFNIPKNAPYGEFHIVAGPKPVVISGEGAGKARVRYVGFVQMTVYVPKEKGTKVATTSGDKFKTIFQFKLGRDSAGSAYKFGVLQEFTPDTEAGWECYVYRVPFTRDSVETVHISQ